MHKTDAKRAAIHMLLAADLPSSVAFIKKMNSNHCSFYMQRYRLAVCLKG